MRVARSPHQGQKRMQRKQNKNRHQQRGKGRDERRRARKPARPVHFPRPNRARYQRRQTNHHADIGRGREKHHGGCIANACGKIHIAEPGNIKQR